MEETILKTIIDSSGDLEVGGAAITYLLNIIFKSYQERNYLKGITYANELLELSKEKTLSYDYKLLPVWIRLLYEDSTILKILGQLAEKGVGEVQEEENRWMQCVKELDMVIIVAGAPGEGRKEIIFQLLKLVQKQLIPSNIPSKIIESLDPPLAKRQKLSTPNYPIISNPIPRFNDFPDFDKLSTFLEKPFIVTGGCKHWSAISKWKNLNYLRKIGGKGRVVPVEVGKSYTDKNWGQRITLLNEFLDSLENLKEKSEIFYLAQHDLFSQLPQLLEDINIPDIIYSAPTPTTTYSPPNTETGYILNSWLGASSLSPAHTDPYYNIYSQVVGKKWIWVAPPSSGEFMSTFGNDESDSEEEGDEEVESGASSYMGNTSKVPISTLPSSIEKVPKEMKLKYPQFIEHVLPLAKSEILEVGDVLVMPPGWWHSMQSHDLSFSVSAWF